jgi:hypothetical protein
MKGMMESLEERTVCLSGEWVGGRENQKAN